MHASPTVPPPELNPSEGELREWLRERFAALERRLDAPPTGLPPHVEQLLGTVERRLSDPAPEPHWEQVLEALEQQAARQDEIASRLREVSLRPAAGHAPPNGDLSTVLEHTASAADNMQRVREIVATLPEIVNTQLEAIGSFDERLTLLVRQTAVLAAMQASVTKIDQGLEQTGRIEANLAGRQFQIAKAINALRDLILQNAAMLKETQAALHHLAGSIDGQTHALKKSVAAGQRGLSTRVTLILIVSLLALAAGGVAAFFAIPK